MLVLGQRYKLRAAVLDLQPLVAFLALIAEARTRPLRNKYAMLRGMNEQITYLNRIV